MDILNGISSGTCEYMKNIDPHHWSRAHFPTQFECDIILNNLCECFNSHILEVRIKRIVTMNKMIRTQLMITIQKKKDAMQKCTTMHCLRIFKKLQKFKQLNQFYNTTWSEGDKYKALGLDGQFVVDKKEGNYSCRRRQLTRLPHSHEISVIYYNKDMPKNYLHDCYKVST